MIMFAIARGLEHGNPFAYFLIFLIFYPPIVIIIFAIVDKIKEKVNKIKK